MEEALQGRDVQTRLPDDLPLASVDPVLIEQLLVNLLDNAVKHTPPGSPIEIAASAREGRLELEVGDRGPGIPDGDEKRVFEKFYRGPQIESRGAGLGLAICRAIADVHGGTLVAENRPGGGALFRFSLPLPGVGPASVVPAESE
jgi:two-component system sensor histidine kinase KdpD